MALTRWKFEALDTLFFRDGRPMNAGESVWIESLFPPNGYTAQGAIRTAILTVLGADFAAFARGEPCLPTGLSLRQELGDATSLGRLRLVGPFLARDEELVFAVPLDLVKSDPGFQLLAPREVRECDLERVRLPAAEGQDLKTQEGKFVKASVMESLLVGRADMISGGDLIPLFASGPKEPGLVDREPKVGLARDNSLRTAMNGMLYSIEPVRPRDGVAIIVGVDGVDESHRPVGTWAQRFGGEGKLVAMNVGGSLKWPRPTRLEATADRVFFKAVLTTPACFDDDWKPGGIARRTNDGTTVWDIRLGDSAVTLVSACVGRSVKIGGWDLKNGGGPRPARPFVPAGSVYFCEASAVEAEKVAALHGTQIGEHQEYGFGHVLIGTWSGGTHGK